MPDLTVSESFVHLKNCTKIANNLYLGGIGAALQKQDLVDQGIRAVVCCMRETEFPSTNFHKDLDYYRVDVDDISREPIELFWPEATQFIRERILRGDRVLVHCRCGVSRSAATVLAYFIAHQGYSLHDALVMSRTHRPQVTPNLGFMEKLCALEVSCRGAPSTIDLSKYESWYTGLQLGATLDFKTKSNNALARSGSDTHEGQGHAEKEAVAVDSERKILQFFPCMNQYSPETFPTAEKDSCFHTVPKLEPARGLPLASPGVQAPTRGDSQRLLYRAAGVGCHQRVRVFAACVVAISYSSGEAHWPCRNFHGAFGGHVPAGGAIFYGIASLLGHIASGTRARVRLS